MIAHFKEPVPDLLRARPDASPELAVVLRKLMAKSPDDRYQLPSEVAAALAPFAAPISGSCELEATPGGTSVSSVSMVPALLDTRPSLTRDEATSPLPMAVECDPGPVAPPTPRSAPTVRQAPPRPARTPKRRGVLLLVIVLLGVVCGALASQWDRLKGLLAPPQQAAVEPQKAVVPAPGPAAMPTAPVAPPPHPIKPPAQPVTPPPPVKQPPPVVPLRNKQVLILVPPDFASGELSTVVDVLKQRGVGTVLVGPEKKSLDGYRFGGAKGPTHVRTIEPDHAAREITGSLLDAADGAIIIPGDPSAYGLKGAGGTDFSRIIKKMIQLKKPVGAIGAGIIDLGVHGFLEHTEVSTYSGRPMAVAQLRVKKWVPEPKVVIDLPIITAGEFSHARELTEAVIKVIAERPGK
jgi:putative intracellular protease/amidase